MLGRAGLLTGPCPQLVVGGLLSPEEDQSLLLSQFREYLDYDDTRYHSMQAAVEVVARVTGQHPEVSDGACQQHHAGASRGGRGWGVASRHSGPAPQVPPAFWNNTFTLLSAVSLPRQEPTVSSFYVKRTGEGTEGQGRTGLGLGLPPPRVR